MKQFEKNIYIENRKIYHLSLSEKLSSTNNCWRLILKAMKNNYD